MKQFVKALLTEDNCCKYLVLTFPGLSSEKLKVVMFDSLWIDSSSMIKISSWQLLYTEEVNNSNV